MIKCFYCYRRARYRINARDGLQHLVCKKHMMIYVSPLLTHLTEKINVSPNETEGPLFEQCRA